MAANSPNDMMRAVTESMKQRTGKSLEEWVEVVKKSDVDPLDQNAVRKWLKAECGILQNTQWAIAGAAARAAGWVEPTVEEYIDGQYTGAKEGLRPIFDKIRGIVESFGDDVSVEGRSTYVPFVRKRQFAAVAAATKTRLDLGLRYTDAPSSKMLAPAKAPGQATHKIELTSPADVTKDVEKLMRAAYEQNG